MKTKTVKVDMINLTVKLYLGTREEIEKKLQKERPGFFNTRYCLGLTRKGEKRIREIYIVVDQKEHSVTSVLVHEITHVVDRALKNRGAENEPEFRAYLTGYLFEEFEKFINKLNNEKR